MRAINHRTRRVGGAVCLLAMFCGAPVVFAETEPGQKPIRAAQGPAMPPEVMPSPPSRPGQPEPSTQPSPCDVACVRRNADPAAQACVPLLEAKSAIDYDWLSRPFGGMFTQAEQPGADGVVRYRGDSIRVLVQNQWLRHAYECAWDTVNNKIVAVQLRPGRLVPPAAVTAMTGGADAGKDGTTIRANSPAEVQRLIQQSLQRAAGTPTAPAPPPPKPKPTWGEPSIVSIRQSHLRTAQIDSRVSISQASRRAGRADRSRKSP